MRSVLQTSVMINDTPTYSVLCPGLKISLARKRLGSNSRLPRAAFVVSYELLGRLRTGLLVLTSLRIACVFLHVERGQSSKPAWRSQQITKLLILLFLQGHV
jgi:hypothetical protein